ncbi:pyrroline-5-carboxylate reductase [Demequina sp. NBRC 110053]|uniref:pyrroline-5-carboxylate reductase n=1 Tax=Demequina sp. NBRC 110053 TaxID=1570342 RepID=UPI000A05F8F0|nr:pyrroline-5-carboxylate reductase [Demequina sp. NBRC 110053]
MHGPFRTLAILGAGNMAGALGRALAASDVVEEIRLTTGASLPAWADDFDHVSHRSIAQDAHANLAAVAGSDAVILGVKPHAIAGLAGEVAPALAPGTLVLSVAGGVTLETLTQALPDHAVAVRTMPNTPVSVGRGITAVAVADGAPEGASERVHALLRPTGIVEPMREELIDGFSAIVGSGPAYVYYVIEALIAAATEQGMSAESAARLVPEMVAGSVEYLQATGRDAGDLREEVTSPGGSTAAALAVLEHGGVTDALREGAAVAAARAAELGRR